MNNLTIKERILKTLEAKLLVDREYMEKEDVKDLEEQIRAVKFYGSFIDDQEKMIDFFTITKEEFLNFYSYLTEEEYEATARDVLDRSGYWNKKALAENKDVEGIAIGKIIQSIMMIEMLHNNLKD